MSDTSQGEGWWQASDLKWYPPKLHSDAADRDRYPSPAPPAEPPDTARLGPGETAVLGTCLKVPVAEVDSLVIRLEDGFSIDDKGVLYDAVQ